MSDPAATLVAMRSIEMLARKAATQQGLLTTAQLHELGETRHTIRTLARHGLLRPVHAGVFATLGSTRGWEQDICAAVLATGGRATASHRSSLRIHQLRPRGQAIDLTVPHSVRLTLPGVSIHRSRDLRPDDIVITDGIATTRLERVLCDVGPMVGPRELRRLTFHAVGS